jgi:uncharacterized membrane protein YkgB
MSQDQTTGMMHAGDDAPSRFDTVARLAGRYALVVVIVWIGAMKYTYYESHGISPLVANSPFLSWTYHVVSIRTFGAIPGTVELITAAMVAAKPWAPRVSVVGARWRACSSSAR